MMSHLTRIGMLFLPSRMGRSHSAAEWTDWDAIECGANVLLHGLTELAAD
jgi:N-carbamoyl-L-amino-acid hydrolase